MDLGSCLDPLPVLAAWECWGGELVTFRIAHMQSYAAINTPFHNVPDRVKPWKRFRPGPPTAAMSQHSSHVILTDKYDKAPSYGLANHHSLRVLPSV